MLFRISLSILLLCIVLSVHAVPVDPKGVDWFPIQILHAVH